MNKSEALARIETALAKPGLSDGMREKLTAAKAKLETSAAEDGWKIVSSQQLGYKGGKGKWYGLVANPDMISVANRRAFIDQLISNINVEQLGIYRKGHEKPLKKSQFEIRSGYLSSPDRKVKVLLLRPAYHGTLAVMKKLAAAAKKTSKEFKPGKTSTAAMVKVPAALWKKIMSAMGSGNDKNVVAAWTAAKKFEASKGKKK